jgi:hypothetical protein
MSKKPEEEFEESEFLKSAKRWWKSIKGFLFDDAKKGLRKRCLQLLPIILIPSGIAYEWAKHSDDDTSKTQIATIAGLTSANANLSSVIQTNSITVQNQSQKIQDLQFQLSNMIADRNKEQVLADSAQNALASWIMLAKSSNTNTPLTERLDMLTKWVERNVDLLTNSTYGSESISNLLSTIESEKPKLHLYCNNQLLTNGSIINLKVNREIKLKVVNESEMSTDGLMVAFRAPDAIGITNVNGDFWQPEGNAIGIDDSGLHDANFHNWLWFSDGMMPGRSVRPVNGLNISTNMSLPSFYCSFKLSANRAMGQRYLVEMVFK